MGERTLQGRELSQTVADLRAHVEYKIERLPELASDYNLDLESIAQLESHLRDELAYLEGLSDGVTLREVMESHFSRAGQAKDIVLGNEC
jgi:hypothetical protein